MAENKDRPQTREEEIANGISHALGILFCLTAMPFALYKAWDQQNSLIFVSVCLFALGILLVYTFSTFYHFAEHDRRKAILQKLDHISIYFLIAGTYTPHMMRYLDHQTAIVFLSVMWSIVAAGILYKIFFINRHEWFSVLLYLILGYMIVFVIDPVLQNIPTSVFYWILAGGISYTIGVYFYIKSHKPYHHTVWHVFVLAGTVMHFVSVYMGMV
ncbi:MAG: hemolysin III family protein [Saprospiraceae bacterium]|nr:hemolysin III family protein [Saprospiraceae bacterium]